MAVEHLQIDDDEDFPKGGRNIVQILGQKLIHFPFQGGGQNGDQIVRNGNPDSNGILGEPGPTVDDLGFDGMIYMEPEITISDDDSGLPQIEVFLRGFDPVIEVSKLPERGHYKEFNIQRAFGVLDEMKSMINDPKAEEDYQKTRQFLITSYDLYEGRKTFEEVFDYDLDDVKYAFIVPARGEYSQEAQQVLDIMKHLDPKNNMDHRRMYMKLLREMCPFALGTYEEPSMAHLPDGKTVGICLYSPQDLIAFQEGYELDLAANELSELLQERTEKQDGNGALAEVNNRIDAFLNKNPNLKKYYKDGALDEEGIKVVKKSIIENGSASLNETLRFGQELTGGRIEVAGLGAVLPGVAEFGAKVDTEKLAAKPTTGHGLTVYAMDKTRQRIFEKDGLVGKKVPMGVIGAGSIGMAVSEVTLQSDPNIQLVIYDKKLSTAKKRAAALIKKYGNRVTVAEDLNQIFKETKYAYSAVTTKLEIDEDIDLEGFVMIDDSEPESKDPADFYAKGGIVVKPVFAVPSYSIFNKNSVAFRRIGLDHINGKRAKYDYGWMSGSTEFGPGLVGDGTIFGCELEAYMNYWWDLHHKGLEKSDKENPFNLRKPVHEKHMEGIMWFEEVLNELIPFDNLQGGGVKVSDRIEATSAKRKEFYAAA